MATKSHSFKAKLEYSTDGGSNYTPFADCRMLKPPRFERGDTEITTLESEEAWKEWAGGWKEPGEIGFEFYWTGAQFSTFLGSTFFGTTGAGEVTTPIRWRVNAPLLMGQTTPARLVLAGYLKALEWGEMSVTSDDAVVMPGTIKCSGKPVFTSGS